MKRLMLKLAVAASAFGFGLATDRILVSRKAPPAPPHVQSVEPLTASVVPVATLTPLPTPSSSPTPDAVFDYDWHKFDVDGRYMPVGRMPKELREFEFFEMWSRKSEDELAGGWVTLTTLADDIYDDQPATFAVVTERRVVFVTSSRAEGGFAYRFDGEFLHPNPAALSDTGKPVLRGTLTKTKHGRKVFEAVVTFRLEFVDC